MRFTTTFCYTTNADEAYFTGSPESRMNPMESAVMSLTEKGEPASEGELEKANLLNGGQIDGLVDAVDCP